MCVRNGQLMFGTLHLPIDASSLSESLHITDSLIGAAAKCIKLFKATQKLPASLTGKWVISNANVMSPL